MGLVKDYLRATRTAGLALGLVCGLVAATSAQAGSLNGHANAYAGWTGTTAFDNGVGVQGTVDWAVFTDVDFPYAGYTPNPGELVYAFQVYSTGPDAIHELKLVDINNAAVDIGSFADLAGETPSAASISSGQILWDFDGLDTGENSSGLAFSSIKVPDNLYGLLINGGSFATAVPLPVPSDVDIPEPASLALLGAGSLMMLRRRN